MARWGLVLGFVFGAIALAAGAASMRWLEGVALWAGMGVFALFLWGAIISVHYFESPLVLKLNRRRWNGFRNGMSEQAQLQLKEKDEA